MSPDIQTTQSLSSLSQFKKKLYYAWTIKDNTNNVPYISNILFQFVSDLFQFESYDYSLVISLLSKTSPKYSSCQSH